MTEKELRELKDRFKDYLKAKGSEFVELRKPVEEV